MIWTGLPVVSCPYMPAAEMPMPCCPRLMRSRWNLDPYSSFAKIGGICWRTIPGPLSLIVIRKRVAWLAGGGAPAFAATSSLTTTSGRIPASSQASRALSTASLTQVRSALRGLSNPRRCRFLVKNSETEISRWRAPISTAETVALGGGAAGFGFVAGGLLFIPPIQTKSGAGTQVLSISFDLRLRVSCDHRSIFSASRERDDLATLAVAVLVTPLTWWLFLGWSWPLSIFGYDDLTLPGLLAIREMVESGQGWSSLVYRPDLLGGVKVAYVNGQFPLYTLGARLGLPPVGVSVFSAFVVQALLGFLGCRAAADLALVWSGGTRSFTLLERVAVVWLCAFAPVWGWRFGVGHPAVLIGMLAFAAALTLVIATAARTPTLTLVAACTAPLVLGLLHTGQQLLVYGVVFGGPLLLCAWISLGGAWRA